MASKSKSPLDLELNLFENSFASKDLLSSQQSKNVVVSDSSGLEATSRSTASSSNSHGSSSLDKSSISISTGLADVKSEPMPDNNLSNQDTSRIPATNASQTESSDVSSGNNKHNLRISNFQSVSDRPTGLTPPIFTPGGRRLPPIQLSPGAAMGSPGTPGSNMWSSLLNVTNGGGSSTSEAYAQNGVPTYPQFMRKSGLIPTESNLRSGLTPGLSQNGFNFNIATLPESLGNGQMTPGLQTLLGLASNEPIPAADAHSIPLQANGSFSNGAAYPVAMHHSNSLSGQFHPHTDNTVSQRPIAVPPNKNSDTGQENNRAKRQADDSDDPSKTKVSKSVKAGSSASRASDKSEKEVSRKSSKSTGEDDKRKQFLERNRVAASKCRQRKKELFNKMESELAFYADGYRELSGQVSQLRDELNSLRNILYNHRDCPALATSVGGFQQLQAMLGQAERVVRATSNAESNFSSIPSTIPTTLKPSPPTVKHEAGEVTVGVPIARSNMSNGHDQPQVDSVVAANGRDQLNYEEVGMRSFPQVNAGMSGVSDYQVSKDNLRPISSTSNLQHQRHAASANAGYDLRPVASMADLQPHNNVPGLVPKQFQLR